MQEPTTIYRGVTLIWRREASRTRYVNSSGESVECPASEWTLKYKFAGPAGAFEITAVADGADYSASATAAATALYPVGEYAWVAVVEKGSGESLQRRIVDTGTSEVKEGPAEYIAGLDKRSHAKKVLDAIEAVILGRATNDQLAYTINGRSLQKTPLPDLLRLRSQYQAEYQRELRAERIRKGLDGGGNVYVRF
jgi:hypothetical protein